MIDIFYIIYVDRLLYRRVTGGGIGGGVGILLTYRCICMDRLVGF